MYSVSAVWVVVLADSLYQAMTCRLYDFPPDYLYIPLQTQCSSSPVGTVYCISASEGSALELITNYVREHAIQDQAKLSIDCSGEWVDFSLLGHRINETGVQLTSLSLDNCQFITGTLASTFKFQESTLETLSITCCTFTSQVALPNLENFISLTSLSMWSNRLYPVENHSEYIIHSSYYVDFTIDVIDMTPCKHAILKQGTCFCNRKNDNSSLACFNVLESDLLKVVNGMTNQNLVSIKAFGLTIDTWSDDFNQNAHTTRLALHLCNRLSELRDLRLKKCKWSTNTSGESSVFDLSPCRGLLEHLELSNCTPPALPFNNLYAYDDDDSSFLTLLYNFPGSLNHIDLNSNGITSLEGLFEQLPLQTLILYGNALRDITVGTFAALAKTLTHLNLRYNAIESMKPSSFEQLIHLETLDIGNNKFVEPDKRWFEKLSTLKALYTGFFDKLTLQSDNFNGLDSLKLLRLPHITHPAIISQHSFRGLGSTLDSLYIADSQYANLPHRLLRPLFSLKILDAYKAGDILRLPGATKDLLVHAETLYRLTYDIDTLRPPCEVLGKMPLLKELTSSGRRVNCMATSETLKWLQQRIRKGNLSIRFIDRIQCRQDNKSLEEYLNSTDFSQVKIMPLASEVQFVYNLTAVKESYNCTENDTSDNGADETKHDGGVLTTTVVIPLTIVFVFVGFCLSKPHKQKWFTCDRRSWFSADDQKGIIKRFYETTTFDGFFYALNTKSLAEKIFWHALIVVFAGLTAQNLAALYVQWTYGPPTTSVDLANNATFCNQPFTVCMPLVQRNISLTDTELASFFTDTMGCRPEGTLPFDLELFLDVLMHRIGHHMIAEASVVTTPILSTFYNVTLLDKLLAERNITYRALLRNISAQLCYALEISADVYVNTPRGQQTIQKLNSSSCASLFAADPFLGLTWYDDTASKAMCLRFPGLFSFTGAWLKARLSISPWRVISSADEFTLDLDGYPSILGTSLLGNPITVAAGAVSKVDFAIEGMADMLEFDRASTKPRCYRRCYQSFRVPDIQKRCKCRPLMWPTDQHSNVKLPDCTVDNIQENCMITPQTEVCGTSIPCKSRKYTIATSRMGETRKGETEILLRIGNTIYTKTVQGPSMTSSDLVGNLGGVLTFWLSVGFMGIIHFVLYFVRFMVSTIAYCVQYYAPIKVTHVGTMTSPMTAL